MSLIVFKSSAGSGKTYTLAKEYLRLALRSADYYKRILAVTFTNRAAEEMKERVLNFLVGISRGEHELISILSKEMDKSEKEIQERAGQTLTHLLHNYGYFNITTIDAFFHRVIRAFSREIGLQGNFSIELDNQKVTEFITGNLFDGVENNEQLKKWLVDFSMNRLGDGRGYEFKNEIKELAGQLFSEEFKKLDSDQFQDEGTKERIKELQQELYKVKFTFEKTLKNIGEEFFKKQQESGIELDEFSGGSKKNLPGFFTKLIRREFKTLINKTVEEARQNADKWAAKTSPKRNQIIDNAGTHFMRLMNEAIHYYQKNEREYFTARAVLKHLYTLGLLNDLTQRLQAYKEAEEVIMISDLPDFLNQIINDSDAPFIYEKVGSRYSHFLIDEFQDTSEFQWRNFRPLLEESLANGHENIIVGDAKQSIYAWRGGDPSILMQSIEEELPMARSDDSNNVNYRSDPNLVEFNNALFSRLPSLLGELAEDALSEEGRFMIEQAYSGVKQQVSPSKSSSSGLVHIEFIEREKERFEKWNAQSIQHAIETIERLKAEGHSLNDMAMLVRTNWEAAQIVQAILDYKRDTDSSIEVISADGMLIVSSRVVRLLITAFNYLLNTKNVVVEKDLVFQYQQVVLGRKLNNHDELSSLERSKLPEAFKKHQEHLLHLPIYELVEVLIRLFKLDQVKEEFAYLQAFQDAILEFTKKQRSDIRVFMDWWKDEEEKRSVQLTGALDAVEVITLHKSKGLQYPIVLVPICKFDLDSKQHTSWYESPETKPFDFLKSVPVEYTSSLSLTQFSGRYMDETAKWFLESLNMLYVAFTRAEKGLYAFCEPPSRQAKAYGNTSSLLWNYFESEKPEGWSDKAKAYKVGSLEKGEPVLSDEHISLSSYPTFKWSNRLTIRKTGRAYFDDEAEKKRNEGILLHKILSEIKYWKDASEVLDRYEKRMEIDQEDRRRFESILDNLWKDKQIKSWFNGEQEVKTEVVVLPNQGETKRMDRVMLNGNNAKVIDFKSGEPRPEDARQVKEYAELLGRMGYSTEGYLLYLKSGEVSKA